MTDQPLLYTVPQVTRLLNLGRSRVYELIRTGALPSVTIGHSRRITITAVRDFVMALKPDSEPANQPPNTAGNPTTNPLLHNSESCRPHGPISR